MVQPESMDVFPRKERRHFIRTFPPSCREGDRPVLCVVQLVQYKNTHSVRYVVFADSDVPLCHTCLLWRPRKVWQNATTIKDFSIKPVSSGWQPFKQMQMLTRHSEPSQCEFHLDKDWPSHLKFHQKVPLLLCQVRPIGWQAFWGGTGRTVSFWFKTNCIYCTFLILLYYQLDPN